MQSQSSPRTTESTARQCLADTLAAAEVHAFAGPDQRELLLNDLVERSLTAYESFRRVEDARRRAWANGDPYEANQHSRLVRTARIHTELGRSLVTQLDRAATERLTVRNVLPFRQAYAELVGLEAMDHGLLAPDLTELADTAVRAFEAGDTQQIDADDTRNGVDSFRTWDFIKRTASLDAHVQRLAERRYRTFFAVDDRHPALGGHPVLCGRRPEGEPSLHIWSVEITFDARALAVVFEPTESRQRRYVWFWIGPAA